MNQSPNPAVTIKATFALALNLVRSRWQGLALFALVFRAIHFAILAPLAAGTLRLFLQRWGRASVGNFEIVSFLLSPTGWLAICLVGGLTAATIYLEFAGLMKIMTNPSFQWWQTGWVHLQVFQKLLRLGIVQLTISLTVALPFVGLIYLVYALLWQGRDLNGLIILKPVEFWWGAGLASLLALMLGSSLLVLYVRWSLAVPVLIYALDRSPWRALTTSGSYVRAHRGLIVKCLSLWFATQLAVSYCLLAIVHFGLLQLLNYPWQTLSTAALATGMTLAIEAFLAMSLSIASSIGLAATVLALYQLITGVAPTRAHCNRLVETIATVNLDRSASRRRWPIVRGILGGVGVLLLCAIGLSYWICDTLKLKESISITAHRAGARYAPENTLTALHRAIQDRADWVEIDVQLTADDQIVVMHDTDLARMGGGTVAVGRSTLAQIQALDVGSLFGAEFLGEKVPLFRDFLEAARGKVKLNVELKPQGKADTSSLTSQVVSMIQAANMVDQCRICSQSYEGIQIARSLEPQMEIGFIAATSLGNLTKLDVNFLMLAHNKVTRQLVDAARTRGIAVHAWTINDPKLVLKLVDAGVDNIITDDVVLISQQLQAIAALHPVERLLLRARRVLRGNASVPEN